MRRIAVAVLAALSLTGVAYAQAAPRVLTQSDIDRFLRDFPPLIRELDKAGANFDQRVAKSQDNPGSFNPASLRSALAAAKGGAEVRKALDKFSWNDRFWDVYYAIFVGVYVSMMDQALAQYPSPELKAQVDAFRASINKEDHTLVLLNLNALLGAFDAAAGDSDS